MHQIDIQVATQARLPFTKIKIKKWANIALSEKKSACEVTLRFVEIEEIRALNNSYRKKDQPTNVLAFPSVALPIAVLDVPFLGDVLICPEVLAQEALYQQKTLEAHWAHIILHGLLHLLGYDHINEDDETIMQHLEIRYLASLDIANPYLEVH